MKLFMLLAGLLFVGAPVVFGVRGLPWWWMALVALCFAAAYVLGKLPRWKEVVRSASAARVASQLLSTLIVQSVLVGVLFLVGVGVRTVLHLVPVDGPGLLDVGVLGALVALTVVRLWAMPPPRASASSRGTSFDPAAAPAPLYPPLAPFQASTTEAFEVAGLSLAFDPSTTISFKDGAMVVELRATRDDRMRAMPKVFGDRDEPAGFRFRDIIFPTRAPVMRTHVPSQRRLSVWLDGFAFGLELHADVVIENGWFHIHGVLRHSYDEPHEFIPVTLRRRFEPQPVDPKKYVFSSLREAAEAGPENVYRLQDIANGESFADIARFTNLVSVRADLPPHQDLSVLSALTQLESLALISSTPYPFPEAILGLTKLKDLTLTTQLETLPPAIGKMSSLVRLHVDGNSLTSLPDSLGQLTELKDLNLTGNQLTSVPEAIGTLPNLRKLRLERNRFTSLPKSLSNIKTVEIEQEHKALYVDISYQSKNTAPIDTQLFLARSDAALTTQLKTLITEQRLASYESSLFAEARWALQFRTTIADDGMSVGATRFGGAPDLPKGFAHPRSDAGTWWHFLAQLNLEELAPLQRYLPRKGVLSFFCQDANHDWENARVFHFTEPLERFSYPADSQFPDGVQYANGFRAEVQTVPTLPSLYRRRVPLSEGGAALRELAEGEHSEQYDALKDNAERASREERFGPHTVNAHVFTQHESPEEQAAVAHGGLHHEWMVLLSLAYDGHTGFEFGDAGTLTFVVHKKDLAIADFSNVFVSLEG